ncbi:hypothetical protein OE88DRAFT_203980 [Heliocybe sulcata]|uniref:Uncharacterized protein n=1 Tax=Heliocybe sulcata TaxID=5364 RepID=A0A5C3N4E4_9AGAM|nr:hypothetical protein OE88DRAFT_203980 [Heliocybe sulcata]
MQYQRTSERAADRAISGHVTRTNSTDHLPLCSAHSLLKRVLEVREDVVRVLDGRRPCGEFGTRTRGGRWAGSMQLRKARPVRTSAGDARGRGSRQVGGNGYQRRGAGWIRMYVDVQPRRGVNKHSVCSPAGPPAYMLRPTCPTQRFRCYWSHSRTSTKMRKWNVPV